MHCKELLPACVPLFPIVKSSHRLTRVHPPRTYNEDYENTEDEEEVEQVLVIKEEAVEEELQDRHSSGAPLSATQALHCEDQVSLH